MSGQGRGRARCRTEMDQRFRCRLVLARTAERSTIWDMKPRIEYYKVAPAGYRGMMALEKSLEESSLEHKLLHLVRLRASQMNGCAYCIDMHWKDARALGETELRLYALDAWREYPDYTDRERAALEWTESLTTLEHRVPDSVYEMARGQ